MVRLTTVISLILICKSLCYCQIPMVKFHTNEHETYPFKDHVVKVFIEDKNDKGIYDTSLLNGENQNLYYENDKLIKREVFGAGEEVNTIQIEEVFEYRYNSDKIDSVFNFSFTEKNKKLLKRTWVYSYPNDSTEIITSIQHNKKNKSIIIRNENMIKKFKLNLKDSIILTNEIYLDEFGRPVKRINYKSDKTIKNTFISAYKTDQIISPSINYALDHKNHGVTRYEYTYNDEDQLTATFRYGKLGKLNKKTSIEYIYDDRGNWIKKKTIISLPERDIENVVFLYRDITYK